MLLHNPPAANRRVPFIRTRRFALLLALIGALGWLGYMIGRQEGTGTDVAQNGSVFLLQEPVEQAGYVNNWWAYRGRRQNSTEIQITVVGEGKLVEFHGTLSPDAEARMLCWHGAQNFGQALDVTEIEKLVPKQAIANLWAWHSSR